MKGRSQEPGARSQKSRALSMKGMLSLFSWLLAPGF
jgi:hypothetical protein